LSVAREEKEPSVSRAGETWRAWTEGEERRLLALRLAGLTHRQVARELGRTEYAVSYRLSLLRGVRPYRRGRDPGDTRC
jgi:DNA-binding NarL/FixJ family response regulator